MDVSSSEGGLISSLEALESLCGQPGWVALASDTDRIIPKYRAFIEASPYVTIATGGPEGPDCSPRGDAPGFVRVSDEKTLLIPDRVGNNRIETLRNLVRDPRIALHFLVPGCGETLRVKGHAAISNNSILLQTMVANGKLPRTVIIVSVERAYFHCGKALKRSRLWENVKQPSAARMPSPNAMLASVQWGRLRERIMARVRMLPIGK
jgi:PPOX class probable FMN-dependent enzyme